MKPANDQISAMRSPSRWLEIGQARTDQMEQNGTEWNTFRRDLS
jgi:hypothetical protein